jgi:Flp pilus assembly pilin Flp
MHRNGQVTLEYFIIFAVVAFVTIVTVTTFDDAVKTALQDLFNAAANKIAK